MSEAKRLAAVILTSKIVESGRSKNGGWSKKQLELIGVEWPENGSPVKGWKGRVVGRKFAVETVEQFLSLKDSHL
jgi:hypothetical protein